MGAYNRLKIERACWNCGANVPIVVQFKYGDAWLEDYKVGDALHWGGNDIGTPGHRRVVVNGISESCPKCGSTADFDVFLERDVITSAELHSDRFDFVPRQESFLVLDD